MGSIARFDLTDLMSKYGVTRFVETGTGTGEGLAHAAKYPFKGVWSCECEIGLAREAGKRFRHDQRVHIAVSDSVEFLETTEAFASGEPALFWLDAHFPGADYGLKPYDSVSNIDTRLPLERELATIARCRPKGKDVIVCDDLRIYMDGPFQHQNLPADLRPLCPSDRDPEFLHEIMGGTHDIEFIFAHEGYVLMTPKGRTDDG